MIAEITLAGLEFYGYHGVYPEEKSRGARYQVDVAAQAEIARPAETDAVEDALDYERLYAVVAEEMGRPRQLLESLAAAIARRILASEPAATRVSVEVRKYNPPLGGPAQWAAVRVALER